MLANHDTTHSASPARWIDAAEEVRQEDEKQVFRPCRPVSTIFNLLIFFVELGSPRLRDGQRPRKRALPPLGTGRPLQTETGLSEIDRAARRANGRESPLSDHRTITTTRTPRVKRKRTTSFREKLSLAAGRHEYECISRFVHTHTHANTDQAWLVGSSMPRSCRLLHSY